jgi:hypothetical protein
VPSAHRLVRSTTRPRPDWQDEPHPLDYVRDWALVSHLAHLAEDGRFDLVAPVLSVAEEALATGDKFTRDLMVAGFLEDLQNALLRTEGRVRLVDVRALLGPKSQAAWDELMQFWYGPTEEARKRLPPGSLPADAR